MKVLLCGARGFIGRHIAAALRAAGHEVLATVSGPPGPGELRVDFARDTTAAAWLPRLAGIDAVVNAVGVLRDTPRRPIAAVHLLTPMALFAACAQAGVRRVLHVSALGIDANDTPYARTKRAAELQLQERTDAGQLDGVVLRPSVVYGLGGASASLFDALALSPLLPLPGPALRSRIQPVHVDDLAQAAVQLLGARRAFNGSVAVVGPRAMSLADFIAELRTSRGRRAARTLALPEWLTRASARLGDACPVTPWGSQTLALLCADNTADASAIRDLLGREPRDPAQFRAESPAQMAPHHA